MNSNDWSTFESKRVYESGNRRGFLGPNKFQCVLGLDIIWIQIQLRSLPLEAILSSATQHGNRAPEDLPFNTNEK
ncbi:hypothetical protein D5086_013612 [Populus alba]|uniref:Uncharacterized protein n=1 Tax=Populus alba TaxID=43335 RepID=A0ACC4C728_POPAL